MTVLTRILTAEDMVKVAEKDGLLRELLIFHNLDSIGEKTPERFPLKSKYNIFSSENYFNPKKEDIHSYIARIVRSSYDGTGGNGILNVLGKKLYIIKGNLGLEFNITGIDSSEMITEDVRFSDFLPGESEMPEGYEPLQSEINVRYTKFDLRYVRFLKEDKTDDKVFDEQWKKFVKENETGSVGGKGFDKLWKMDGKEGKGFYRLWKMRFIDDKLEPLGVISASTTNILNHELHTVAIRTTKSQIREEYVIGNPENIVYKL